MLSRFRNSFRAASMLVCSCVLPANAGETVIPKTPPSVETCQTYLSNKAAQEEKLRKAFQTHSDAWFAASRARDATSQLSPEEKTRLFAAEQAAKEAFETMRDAWFAFHKTTSDLTACLTPKPPAFVPPDMTPIIPRTPETPAPHKGFSDQEQACLFELTELLVKANSPQGLTDAEQLRLDVLRDLCHLQKTAPEGR